MPLAVPRGRQVWLYSTRVLLSAAAAADVAQGAQLRAGGSSSRRVAVAGAVHLASGATLSLIGVATVAATAAFTGLGHVLLGAWDFGTTNSLVAQGSVWQVPLGERSCSS